ncbi:hypothetical protein ABIA39_004659 [Nocardia sp. GAS34]
MVTVGLLMRVEVKPDKIDEVEALLLEGLEAVEKWVPNRPGGGTVDRRRARVRSNRR